ncbi:hypothetical protein PS880_00081 [Pseudomonas fluorescens]|uniref:Uncharacterized protein n=1 Tax=Pseudomonas fluorescens TaxID=294 RepID=A0A5E7G4E5_PSEFL|nr:hypothetical protein PS880_00081 [Pseudomonas fluorescens]
MLQLSRHTCEAARCVPDSCNLQSDGISPMAWVQQLMRGTPAYNKSKTENTHGRNRQYNHG